MAFLADNDEALHAWGDLFVQLAPLIITLGLVGIIIIVGLLVAWRRFQTREDRLEARSQDRQEPGMHVDAWGSAGQRLEPVAARPAQAAPEPSSYDDEEEDPDDNAPWRESLGDLPDFGEDEDEDFGDNDEGFDEDWPRPR